ncbi:hypothetical protein AB0L06_17340 [Spirillospora sp. NPDC052269]
MAGGVAPVFPGRAAEPPLTVHLDRLAIALADKGWVCDRRYKADPPRLDVYDPGYRWLCDTITVASGPGVFVDTDIPWFRSSNGAVAVPCPAVLLAAAQIHQRLEAWLREVR